MGRKRINKGKTHIKTICVGIDINDFLNRVSNTSQYVKFLIYESKEYKEFSKSENNININIKGNI